MKHFWKLIVVLTFVGCNYNSENSAITDFIPNDTFVILNVANLESTTRNLVNNDFLQKFSNSEVYNKLTTKLDNLNYLKPSENLLVCLSKTSNDSLHYTLITKYNTDLFKVDSLPNYKSDTLKFKKHKLLKTSINNHVTYSTVHDSIFIASSSKAILEASLSNTNTNQDLKSVLKTASKTKAFSVLVNHKQNNILKSFFINDSISTSNFTNYTLLDTEIDQDNILLNGITKATDSTKSLINIFKNTIPQENVIARISPANSDGFMSFTFDDFYVFKDNLKQFNSTDSIAEQTTLFDDITEVGIIYEDQNKAIVLNSIDVIATKDALLSEQNKVEQYRQVTIYNFSQSDLFSKTFAPLITFKQAKFYAEIDNFFVFANSKDMLQNIIASYQNKTTLSERGYYQNIKTHLTNDASLLIVTNHANLEQLIDKNFTEDFSINADNYKSSALQFIYDTNFAHVNAVVKKSKTKVRENSVTEAYTIKLNADLLTNPQLVSNHITKQKDVVAQDINNNLFLISNTGKVLWKKQLQGTVLGDVQQIDMYRNGRLQLVFATPNRVYILDRNGKDVSPFPLKFNDKITQPLSVFDYDNTRKYRLLVTQGKNLTMYDIKGKVVKGFKYKPTADALNHQPQHFRIGKKDYLTVKTNNKLYILDRVGKPRISPKNNYTYSNQAVYLYKNKFTTTTANGQLVTIDSKGNTATQNLNLSEKHKLVATSKTLVSLTENKLTIKNKTLELDFGNYSSPKLFYINNKIFISVTDLQSQKIYLYDSNAKLQDNFPVYGTATIALDNMDKDNNLEFTTKGENNTVIIYQIH